MVYEIDPNLNLNLNLPTDLIHLTAMGPHAGALKWPHDMSFNADFFPAAVVNQGPVWHDALQDVPIAAFLEANYERF